MTSPTHTPPDLDETAERLRRERPAEDVLDLDAELHLARLRQKHAGTEGTAPFRKWEVERRLGRGGMGTVYLARDPALDRRVALKLIRPADGRSFRVDQARAIREARALASCEHPNIVRVISVDDSDPGVVVIEMEYVDGQTLRTWSADPRRSWREVVEAYAAAADGLAAIHASKIVHRDIKPDNLLVSAAGVVKVADFGLAISDGSTVPDADGAGSSGTSSALALRVTSRGALVGTHGYIAPEVLAGVEATAQSDVFSLATALFEALFDALPYRGDTPHALALALRSGAIEIPEGARSVPEWVLRILRCALAPDPGQRFSTTHELSLALRRGLRRRRLWVISGVLVSVAIAGFVVAWSVKPLPPDPCVAVGEPLRDAWTEARAALIAGQPATPARDLLVDTVDLRVKNWIDNRRRLCASERRRSALDIAALEAHARQRSCLDHALHSVQAHLGDHMDAAVGGHTHAPLAEIAGEVEAIPTCEDHRVVARWPLTYSERDDEGLAKALADAFAQELAGEFEAAELRAREVASADPERHPLRHAEGLYRLGHIFGTQHRLAAALAALAEAQEAAVRNGHDMVACQVAIYRAKVAANVGLDIAASARAIGEAEAWRDRMRLRSPILRADLIEARGLLAEARGDLLEAVDRHREALALRRAALGEDHPDVAKSLLNLANALAELGEDDARDKATANYQEALDLRVRVLGPTSTRVADVLADFGRFQAETSPKAARASLLRALALFEAAGADDAAQANLHVALAELDRDDEDLDAAQAHLDRARDLQSATKDLPSVHPDRARLLLEEGRVALRRLDFRRAQRLLRDAYDLFRRDDGESSGALAAFCDRIEALRGLGDHAAIVRQVDEEGPRLAPALDGLTAADRGKLAWYIADSFMHERAPVDAARFFRIALAAYAELGDTTSIAELRWELAQALAADAEDAEEALRLAEAALAHFRDHRDRQTVATISRWLTQQRQQRSSSSPRFTTSKP